MQRIIFLTLALLLLTVGNASAADLKFGVVNLQEVLKKSEPGLSAQEAMKEKLMDVQGDLEKRKKEIEDLRSEMEKQNLVLTLEAKQDKELEFKRKVRDYQDMLEVYRRRVGMEQSKLTKPIEEVLIEVLKEYGSKNKFTMLFDKGGNGMLYADDALDVTNDIILELNKAWRAKK